MSFFLLFFSSLSVHFVRLEDLSLSFGIYTFLTFLESQTAVSGVLMKNQDDPPRVAFPESLSSVNNNSSDNPTEEYALLTMQSTVKRSGKWTSGDYAHGRVINVDDAMPSATAQIGGPRRDARYRKLQTRIYNFLERPRGFRALAYHVVV